MRTLLALATALLIAALTPAMAHHGWGSYDARNPVTVEGKIVSVKYENPHVVVSVEAKNETWTLILAPTSRMMNRGAFKKMFEAGKSISAFGYPSKEHPNELRAERITVERQTVEMR